MYSTSTISKFLESPKFKIATKAKVHDLTKDQNGCNLVKFRDIELK